MNRPGFTRPIEGLLSADPVEKVAPLSGLRQNLCIGQNDSFSSNDFHWNEEAEEYRCPAGNVLRSEWRAFKNERSHVTKANTIIFRSRQTDCATCPMKAKCWRTDH